MRSWPATEPVAPHDTLKAPAFGRARYVNQLPGTKQIGLDDIANVMVVDTIGSEFAQLSHQAPCTGEMPPLWSGEMLGSYLAVTELDRLIAISIVRPQLCHDTWANFEHRDGDDLA
jgi:hypothetical protein